MVARLFPTTAALAALACVPDPSGIGRTFPVSDTTRPAKECVEMGPVQGRPWRGILRAHTAANEAIEDLKKAAADVGANYVRVDRMDRVHWSKGAVIGTAFLCSTEPL